jgi:hypothetical protein
MAQPLLEGHQEYVDPTNYSQQIQELRDDFSEYQRQVQEALTRIGQSIAVIRQGLRMAGGDEITTVPLGSSPQFDPKWKAWQDKLGQGTAPARVIGAILDHGPLNRSQLRQAAEMGWSTLDAATARLKNLSLIEKVGDRWNLKS